MLPQERLVSPEWWTLILLNRDQEHVTVEHLFAWSVSGPMLVERIVRARHF